jgi:hypothetical protein
MVSVPLDPAARAIAPNEVIVRVPPDMLTVPPPPFTPVPKNPVVIVPFVIVRVALPPGL